MEIDIQSSGILFIFHLTNLKFPVRLSAVFLFLIHYFYYILFVFLIPTFISYTCIRYIRFFSSVEIHFEQTFFYLTIWLNELNIRWRA